MNSKISDITRNHLHISHSQIWTYLNCSLRYWFQYVKGIPKERASIALIFGGAAHKALERYYLDIMRDNGPTDLATLQDIFTDSIIQGTENTESPILYKKDTPDKDQAIAQGNLMLEKVYPDLAFGPGLVVAGVEMPLAAPVKDPDGNDMDMVLTGILDLVLMDTNTMTPIVVDFKTAKLAKSRAAADEDIQLSMYAYLMDRAGYADLSKPLPCRFQVLRKLKTPKLETVTTFRTQAHMPRLEKLMHAVLTGIEHQVFIPCKSWLCADCAYADACRDW
jgi:putative RecB family exonuclease